MVLPTVTKQFNIKRINRYLATNRRHSIAVSIPACHAGDPGSIPGDGGHFNYIEL